MKTTVALKNIMLSKIKLLLEELEIPYWLESGTQVLQSTVAK